MGTSGRRQDLKRRWPEINRSAAPEAIHLGGGMPGDQTKESCAAGRDVPIV